MSTGSRNTIRCFFSRFHYYYYYYVLYRNIIYHTSLQVYKLLSGNEQGRENTRIFLRTIITVYVLCTYGAHSWPPKRVGPFLVSTETILYPTRGKSLRSYAHARTKCTGIIIIIIIDRGILHTRSEWLLLIIFSGPRDHDRPNSDWYATPTDPSLLPAGGAFLRAWRTLHLTRLNICYTRYDVRTVYTYDLADSYNILPPPRGVNVIHVVRRTAQPHPVDRGLGIYA